VQWSILPLWPLKKEEIEAFVNTIAQFTNARSIHNGFYQLRTIDDNQKWFFPHLVIDNDFFFHSGIM
jgi:hypothetical protein